MLKGKIFKKFLLVLFTISILFQSSLTPISADTGTNRNETKITSISVTDTDGQTLNEIGWWDDFKLNVEWDASSYGNILKAGDYFDVELPSKIVFPTNSVATKFDILAPDNSVLAKAVVTSDGTGGGSVKVTFTDYVNNRYNIKGDLWLSASLNRNEVTAETKESISITIGGKVSSVDLNIGEGPQPIINQLINKWSNETDKPDDEAEWVIRINHKKATYSSAIISDTLTDENGNPSGETYIEDSFILLKVEQDQYGSTTNVLEENNVSNQVVLNGDKTEFKLDLGPISDTYILRYKSTYTPGVKLMNKAFVITNNDSVSEVAYYGVSDSGGKGSGNYNDKIVIKKVDALDNNKFLVGAIFKITNVETKESFQIVTDENGEAVSPLKLSPGDYEIQEMIAPIGYALSEEVYIVTIVAGQSTTKVIENTKETRDISVIKKWIGEVGESATIRLQGNGEEIDSVVLSDNNSWSHTFSDLPKYDEKGVAISYTITEDYITNYMSEILGFGTDNFTVTNTYEKEVPPKEEPPKEEPKKEEAKKVEEKKELPKTGYTSQILIGAALTLVGVSIILIGKKKFNK